MSESIIEHATRANFGRDPYTIEPDSLGHRIRGSDSSIYDVRCVTCDGTDAIWSDKLKIKCPAPLPVKA